MSGEVITLGWMNQVLHSDWKKLFLLLLGLGWAFGSYAQVDSTIRVPSADTLNPAIPIATVPFPDSLVMARDSAGFLASTEEDSLKRIQKVWQEVQAQLPELYEENNKMRLRIHFPWRDDVVLPFPKGVLPQPRPPPYDATVAWQRSLLIPGWGQAYNRAYWKIPVFLVGYGGGIWFASFNQTEYLRYRTAFLCKLDDACDPGLEFASLDSEGIRNRRNNFRQNRDYAILGVIGWHLIQVAEAYVDAHLNDFDVSDDLSLEFSPSMQTLPYAYPTGVASASIGIRF